MKTYIFPSMLVKVKNIASMIIFSHIFEKDIFKTKIQFSPNSLY